MTFPNSEVLRSNIVNFTRDFPFVWDEITVNVADESDLDYAGRVFHDVATRVVGPAMMDPAHRYRTLLEAAGFAYDVAAEPRVFFAMTESFTNVTVRYLVPARERRVWSSRLFQALATELNRPEHRGADRVRLPQVPGLGHAAALEAQPRPTRAIALENSRIDAPRRMIERNPNDPRLRFGLALELEKLGRWDEVAAELHAYLALTDDEDNAWGRLGNALRRLGRDDESRSAYRQGIDAAHHHGHPSMAAEFEEVLGEWEA